jgi:hypothetical protein
MIIYTAIFGGFHKYLIPPKIKQPHKLICFSDKYYKSTDWKTYKVKSPFNDPRLSNRWYKINSHLLNEEWSVYIDGNRKIIDKLEKIYEFAYNGIAIHKHESRSCLYEEANACIKQNKDPINVAKQIKYYKEENIPPNLGLYGCSVIVRKNTPNINALNEMWFEEIIKGSIRDQISLPYVLYKNKITPNTLPGNHIFNEYTIRLSKPEINMLNFL